VPTTREKFLMGNKIYCHPLNHCGSKSRFLFTAKGHYHEKFIRSAKASLQRSLEHSFPEQYIRTMQPLVLCVPSKIYATLPIEFIEWDYTCFSDPAHPEQKRTGMERMHRDLKRPVQNLQPMTESAAKKVLNTLCKGIQPHKTA